MKPLMTDGDVQVQHLENVISFLKAQRTSVIRGYEMAIEDLGREGDFDDKNWSEPYEYLKKMLAKYKGEAS